MDLMSLMIKIGADISGAQQGMESVQQEMEQTEKKSKGIGSKLSGAFKTAATGVGVAVAAVGAATAAVTKLTTAAAATTDRIDKMSQKIGVSRSTFQELDFIMSQSGGSVESLQAGMKTLSSAMTSADGGSKDAIAAFNRLGVSIKDSNGNFRNQEDVMFDALEALQKVGDETERNALAQTMFGKSAIELKPLLNSGAGSIEEMRKQAHELGLVLDDDAIDAGVKLTDTMDQVKRAFDSIKTKIGVALMPVVQKILEYVLDKMPVIQKVLGVVFNVLGTVVKGGVKLIGVITKPITNLINLIVNGAGKIASSSFVKKITQTFGKIKDSLANGFNLSTILGTIFTGGKSTLRTDSIATFFDWVFRKPLFKAFSNIFGDSSFAGELVNSFQTVLRFVDNVKYVVTDAFRPFVNSLKTLKNTISGVFSGKNSISDIGAALKNVWRSLANVDWNYLWTVIREAFSNIWSAITGLDWARIGATIWSTIQSGITFVGDWLKDLLGYSPSDDWLTIGADLWTKIKTGVTNAVSAVSDWLKNALGYSPSDDWLSIGGDIWDKIKTGVSNAVTAVSDWLKDALGYSPSDSWGDIGGDVWAKITSGISAAATAVSDWLKDILGYSPSDDWSDIGGDIWEKIKTGISTVVSAAGDWLKTILGYSPSDEWGAIGGDIWGRITEGITTIATEAGDWLKTLLGYEPSDDWSTIGGDLWEKIKTGISNIVSAAGDWLKSLVLGDEYTPDASWSQVGASIWSAIVSGLGSAVDWLTGLFTDWTDKLTNGDIDFASIGSTIGNTIWGAIRTAFEGIVSWFSTLFGGSGDEGDTASVKGAIGAIDWGGLGSSIVGLITAAFTGIGETIKSYFVAVWDNVNGINWGGLGRNMWNAIKKPFKSIADWFTKTFKAPINAVIGLLNAMISRTRDAINTVIDAINSKLTVYNPFTGGVVWSSNIQRLAWSDNTIPALANGGTVTPGNSAIVGEAGAELLRNINGRAVVTPLGVGAASGDTITFNIYQQPGESAEALADKVQRVLVRRERQRRSGLT